MHKSTLYSKLYHFADDTNLLFTNKNYKTLRKNANHDLKLIFEWLCANRLSINVDKTEFIIFKPMRKVIPERITLRLNNKTIFESKKLRYLGLIVDDKLSWKHHITELKKQLCKTNGIIYNLKKIGAPIQILKSVYYSLFESYLNYGLICWGQSDGKNFHKIEVMQNKAVRIISGSEYDAHCDPIYKDLNIIKVKDLLYLKYSSLMWDFDHNDIPNNFKDHFVYANQTHRYSTRFATAGKLCENKKFNTERYGLNSFTYMGPKILNSLKDNKLYREAKSKVQFLKNYKKSIVERY